MHVLTTGLDIIFKADATESNDNSDEHNKITLEQMLKGPFTIIIFLSVLVIVILLLQLLIHQFS